MKLIHTGVIIVTLIVLILPNMSGATIFTDKPPYRPCQLLSEVTKNNLSMAERNFNSSYKYECWKFLIKNTPEGTLGPGPYQWLRPGDRKLIQKAEDDFSDHWKEMMEKIHGKEWWKRMDEVLKGY